MNNFIYIKYQDENLQTFYALLAFIEKYSHLHIFIFDNANFNLLTKCNLHIKFIMINIDEVTTSYSQIDLLTDHKIPITILNHFHNSPLIFPRLILRRYFKKFNSKFDKIFFKGNLSASRIIDSFFLFIENKDFLALIILIKNLFLLKKQFIINTKKSYFEFTLNGRNNKIKYIDPNYFNQMSMYKYIFCPKGDYLWTYRFFETIQVGSIPICKIKHNIYEEFYFQKTLCFNNINYLHFKKLIKINISIFSKIYYV